MGIQSIGCASKYGYRNTAIMKIDELEKKYIDWPDILKLIAICRAAYNLEGSGYVDGTYGVIPEVTILVELLDEFKR